MRITNTEEFIRNDNLYDGRIGLVYARVSSKSQETDGTGLGSQEGRCIQELENIGVKYVRTFPDSVSGGGDFMNRPGMREMLSYIETHPHQRFVVVFDDLKRFARDTVFHLKLRLKLNALDVLPRCLNYKFDDSPEGMYVETILSAGNELERHQNRRQVIQKQKARLDLGYWPFGSKKGYTMKKQPLHGKISVINEDGLILKEALERFADRSLKRKIDVCRFLVKKGFWRNQSPERYIDKLTHILKDPFYCGDIEYLPWDVARRPGRHKGIISSDTFRLIQNIINQESAGKRIRCDISEDFKLRGLLVCECCNSHLTGAWSSGRSKKYPYYFCQKKGCSNKGKSISVKQAEKDFIKLLKNTKLKDDIDSVIVGIFDSVWQEEINVFKKQNTIRVEQKNLLNLKAKHLTEEIINSKNKDLREIYEMQLKDVSKEIKGLKFLDESLDFSLPYRTALEKSKGVLKNPYSAWEKLTVLEQQSLFYFIFDDKLVYSKKIGYRTEEKPYSIRLFEEFATTNTQDVEMAGIEPACK